MSLACLFTPLRRADVHFPKFLVSFVNAPYLGGFISAYLPKDGHGIILFILFLLFLLFIEEVLCHNFQEFKLACLGF